MYAAWSFKICERRRSLLTWMLKQEQKNKNKKPEREVESILCFLYIYQASEIIGLSLEGKIDE